MSFDLIASISIINGLGMDSGQSLRGGYVAADSGDIQLDPSRIYIGARAEPFSITKLKEGDTFRAIYVEVEKGSIIADPRLWMYAPQGMTAEYSFSVPDEQQSPKLQFIGFGGRSEEKGT